MTTKGKEGTSNSQQHLQRHGAATFHPHLPKPLPSLPRPPQLPIFPQIPLPHSSKMPLGGSNFPSYNNHHHHHHKQQLGYMIPHSSQTSLVTDGGWFGKIRYFTDFGRFCLDTLAGDSMAKKLHRRFEKLTSHQSRLSEGSSSGCAVVFTLRLARHKSAIYVTLLREYPIVTACDILWETSGSVSLFSIDHSHGCWAAADSKSSNFCSF